MEYRDPEIRYCWRAEKTGPYLGEYWNEGSGMATEAAH